ncbi:hypothetical protein [Pseudofulvimonas gallinarii]|uniref:Uncharacterized protein n=2 Tax=Pseudofulvimonas gallinarii TaxID=634155 RepID=A0A4R3LN34_9GAMM|nr:hypothetical protein [Pseudofulvimonas gallinarii]TCS99306.1 hypothetical protein EDC25_106145 [Pseudofulvimonas gallinarii]
MTLAKPLMATVALALAAFTGTGLRADDIELRGTPAYNNMDYVGWVGTAADPSAHTAAYISNFDNSSSYDCANGGPGGSRLIRYPFMLPDLRQIHFVRIWGQKADLTADLDIRLRRSCTNFLHPVPPVMTTIGTTSVAEAPGYFSALIGVDSTEMPDNALCRYVVEVEMGSAASACAAYPGALRIMKIRVQSSLTDRIFRSAFREAF